MLQSESEDERQRRRLAEMFPDFSAEFEDILLQDPTYRAAKERAKEEADELARANGTAPQAQVHILMMSVLIASKSIAEYISFSSKETSQIRPGQHAIFVLCF